jgi:Protein of unknown function (DUF3617)
VRKSRLGPLLAFAIVAAVAAGRMAVAEELPQFRQGLWSYSSTKFVQGNTRPRARNLQVCVDPTRDMQKKWQTLALRACKFSPIAHDGNRYTYTSTCQSKGVSLQATSTISADSDSSYRVETESRADSFLEKEIILARRVGDCASQSVEAPGRQPSGNAQRRPPG